jgi:hypothetical protein
MSGVFRNIDPPHPLTSRRVREKDTLAVWRGGGGSTVRKTPDTALYSIYVSTLWAVLILGYKSTFPIWFLQFFSEAGVLKKLS